MPQYDNSGKLGWRKLTASNPISAISDGFAALAEDAENSVATFDSGTLAERPASTAEKPGVAGRYYYATDAEVLYLDLGTAWKPLVGKEAITATYLAAGAVETAAIADGGITGVKLGSGTSRQEPGSPQTVRSWGFISGTTIEAGTGDFTLNRQTVNLNTWRWTITFSKVRKTPYLLFVEGQPEGAITAKSESTFTLESKADVLWGFEVVAEA